MSQPKIKVEWATAADIQSFYERQLPYTIRAIALKIDGEIVAMGGVYSANVPLAVMDFRGGIPKKSIWRATREAILKIFERYPAVYARRDPAIPSSARYLEKIGFVPVDDTDEVFVWLRPSHS